METSRVNVNQIERIASTALGVVLLVRSLKHPSFIKTALGLDLLYRGISGHSYLYQVLGINTADGSKQLALEEPGLPEVTRAITVGKPAEELYLLWRNPQRLSQIMGDTTEITEMSEDHLHWKLRVPFGLNVAWDMQIIEDRPGELLRWKSREGARLPSEGSICFQPAPGERGTEVKLHLRFEAPGGRIGNAIAKRMGFVPRMLAEQTLRRLKSLAETGEIPTLEHNPSARSTIQTQSLQHAQTQSDMAAMAP